jgi:hypothetical protein
LEVRLASAEDTERLSGLSVQLGNIPLLKEHSIAALLEHRGEIIGFAATQSAQHAAGSWVKDQFRRQGYTYALRECLDNELRSRGCPVYFAFPDSDFERNLFAKYGRVTEHLAQIRYL